MIRLNREAPLSAIDDALSQLLAKRQAMSAVAANYEVDALLRHGVLVEFDDENGNHQEQRLKVIDFDDATKNEFLAVAQMWVKGERGYRRPDVLLYVNGVPLIFVELKNSNIKLKTAYEYNIAAYRRDVPQLFEPNAFCVLSNGLETRVGSMTAEWEHFFTWLRVNDETEKVDREKIEETKNESLARV